MLIGTVLLATLLLPVACSSGDEPGGIMPGETPTVTAQLNFSLPARIVGRRAATRMEGDIVQADGTEESFRGIDDVHLFCFDQAPTETTTSIGNVIEMSTEPDEETDSVTREDYSLRQEISIPIGTSHFAFYARAADAPRTHEEKMRYGIIETVGLSRQSYQGNESIRFRPVPICTSEAELGGSAAGQALLQLLNSLVDITGPEEAPNDRMATANNLFINEAYKRLTSMKTLSSASVQTMLGVVYAIVNQKFPDEQGALLAEAIATMIEECSDGKPDTETATLTLKDEYQGFPADLHLPEGAARIEWNAEQGHFVVPDVQSYGKGLDVMNIGDYVYPMNLQYQVFSDIVVSDTLVIGGVEEEDTATPDSAQYKNWSELISKGYEDALKVVQPSTRSVAMVKQVEYAVGHLELYARVGTDAIMDAADNTVAVSDGTFTLKGYIIGGQREVDYNFQPIEESRLYAIYDSELNGGRQRLRRKDFTVADYILGLGTKSDEHILMAMELENNGAPFQGADGTIATGATFYLVADMDPERGQGYSSGSLDQIFSKDRATKVYLTINSLSSATYGLPDLDIPRPTFGVSVDLSWSEGFWFDDIIL